MYFVERFSLTDIEREPLRPISRSNFTLHTKIVEGFFDFWSDFVFEKEEKDSFILVLTFFYNITFCRVKSKKNVKKTHKSRKITKKSLFHSTFTTKSSRFSPYSAKGFSSG